MFLKKIATEQAKNFQSARARHTRHSLQNLQRAAITDKGNIVGQTIQLKPAQLADIILRRQIAGQQLHACNRN